MTDRQLTQSGLQLVVVVVFFSFIKNISQYHQGVVFLKKKNRFNKLNSEFWVRLTFVFVHG